MTPHAPLSLLAAAALLVGCSVGSGDDTLHRAEVEETIAAQLAEQFPEAPEPIIDCPDELEAAVGATTRCRLSVEGDDEVYPVAVEVTAVEDGHATFEAEVGENPL